MLLLGWLGLMKGMVGDQTGSVRRAQSQATRNPCKGGEGRTGSGVQESPCAGMAPVAWVEVVGQATPQAWHLVGEAGMWQEHPPRPSTQGSLEWWLRVQAEAPNSLGLILASALTSCVATGQLHHLLVASAFPSGLWGYVALTQSAFTAAWRISTEMQHLAQGCVQSVG